MEFKDNQTIAKSKEETWSKDIRIKPNIFLYIILVLGATFLGEVISGIVLSFTFGTDFLDNFATKSSDIYNIISTGLRIFTIIASLFVAKKYLNRSYFSLGIRKENAIKDYGQGIILSLLQIASIVLLAVLFNSAKLSLNKNINVTYFLLFTVAWMIQGFSEELMCRSLFMNGFAAFVSTKKAIIYNALIFSLIHLGNNSVSFIALLNLFLSGISYSLIFYLKDSVWMVAAAHSFWNMIQGNVFGISVSGFPLSDATLLNTSFAGSNLITGGEFGIEASIICTLVEVLVIVVAFSLIKKRELVEK